MRKQIFVLVAALVLSGTFVYVVRRSYFNETIIAKDSIPTVSGLKLGLVPLEAESILGKPISSPDSGIWTYKNETIVGYDTQNGYRLFFATGRTGGFTGNSVLNCPVATDTLFSVLGAPHEVIDHFESKEFIYRTMNGVLIASSNKQNRVYLFKLSKKYPLAPRLNHD
jgi:hypothetical protein